MLDVLTVDGSIASRNGRGGTATERVRDQLDEVASALDAAGDLGCSTGCTDGRPQVTTVTGTFAAIS